MPKKAKSKTKSPKSTRPDIPGYGLPKSKKGLLPWKWAEAQGEQAISNRNRETGQASTCDGGLGAMARWQNLLQHGKQVAEGQESRQKPELHHVHGRCC